MLSGMLQYLVKVLGAVGVIMISATASLGQENLFQISRVGNGESVELPPETTGRADFDQAVFLLGHPDGSVLSAPQDDAVIVAHQGGEVHLSDVILQKSGATRFGVYVNGGHVALENCLITGGFDTAIYVGAGTVSLTNCSIEGGVYGIAAQQGTLVEVHDLTITGSSDAGLFVNGASAFAEGLEISGVGNSPLYIAGPGEAELVDVVVDGNGQSRVVLLNGLNVSVDGMLLTGQGGDGLVAQNAGQVALANIATEAGLSSGVIVQGAQGLEIEGFVLSALDQPLQISGVAGPTQIATGQVHAGPAAYGISIFENNSVDIHEVSLKGGEIGVFAQGPLGELTISESIASGQNTYGVLLQNMGGGPAPTLIENNRITATGEAIAVAALDGGFVGLSDNVLIAEGPTAVYLQDSAFSENAGNLIVSAPDSLESTVLFYPDEDRSERLYLTDGPVAPVEGWFDENEFNTVLSHIRVLKQSDDDELRRAIAEMVSGAAVDSGEILDQIALDMALSRDTLTGADDLVTVSLAPPQEGWKWSDEAIGVVLEPLGGEAQVFFPDEFPVRVAKGQYRLLVDGEYRQVLDLTGDHTLQLDQPVGPYAIWRDEDGTVWRGPGMQLRKQNALQALADGLRPLEIGEYYGHQKIRMRRAGVSNSDAEAAVATARALLPDMIERMQAEREAENWDNYNRLWTVQRMYFDLVGALGGEDELNWLHEVFADQDLPFQSMYAAVQIEQRLGLRSESINRQFALDKLQDDADHYQARQMLGMLARAGDAAALSKLAELFQSDMSAADALTLPGIGVAEAFDLPPALGLPIYRSYLAKLQSIALEFAGGAEVDWANLNNTEVWRNATRAILYLSQHGSKEDQALFDLPVPVQADFYPLTAVMAYPADAVEVYFGSHGPMPEYRMNNWQNRYGEMVCPALSLATEDRRETLLLKMNWAMRDVVIREYYPDYWDLDSRTRQGAETSIRMIDDMSRAHCGMTETVLNLATGEDAWGEYSRKLQQSDLNPHWWIRTPWAADRMATLGRAEPYASVEGLAPYPTDQLKEMMFAAGSGDPEMVAAFDLWHSLLTDAYQTPQGFFPFGSERRLFRMRNDGGNGSLSLAGIVDLRLLPEDGKLTIAIANNIQSPDYGGLAAMITAPDREPFEQNNHRNVIGSVRLERDGAETEASFVQTIEGGVHIFEVPFDGVLENTYLRVGMQFTDVHWPLDYALYDSQLSYTENLTRTGATLWEGVE